MSTVQISLISDIVKDYSEYLRNRNISEDCISELLASDTTFDIKLQNVLDYIKNTYQDCCILNQWPPSDNKSQCIHRLYFMIYNLIKEFQKPIEKPETISDILLLKHTTFVDHSPTWITIKNCKPVFKYTLPENLNYSIERAHKIKDLHIIAPQTEKMIKYLTTDEYIDSDNIMPAILPNEIYNLSKVIILITFK